MTLTDKQELARLLALYQQETLEHDMERTQHQRIRKLLRRLQGNKTKATKAEASPKTEYISCISCVLSVLSAGWRTAELTEPQYTEHWPGRYHRGRELCLSWGKKPPKCVRNAPPAYARCNAIARYADKLLTGGTKNERLD